MRKELITFVLVFAFLSLVQGLMTPQYLSKYARLNRKNAKRELVNATMFQETNSQSTYSTAYYSQIVDHFNYNDLGVNSNTWQQRYIFNNSHWGGNETLSPIFFYTGNEGDITEFWNNSGNVVDVLPVAFKAYVLFAEHRYFGTSMPFGENSFKNGNQLFLTTEQALADYVVFLHWFKNEVVFCPDCPVIAFGGSYGGMLSSWMRMKFPNVIDGAIAASAPILLFDDVVPEELAYEIITYDFGNSTAAPQCAKLIKQGFNALDSYIADGNGNQYKTLNEMFDLCTPMTSNEEISDIEDWLINAYFTMAMGDYPYPTDFLGPMPGYPVNYGCQAFIGLNSDDSDEELINAMYKAAMIYYNFENVTQCNQIFSDSSDDTTDISDLGWPVLSCTEMILPMGSNGVNDMFPYRPWNYTENTISCNETWGVQSRYDWALNFYGGWNIQEDFQYYTNIFFSNGILDPWRAGGVVQNISSSVVSYIMPSAHHLDLRTPNILDPLEVQVVRGLEAEAIQNWIQQKRERVLLARQQQQETIQV